MDSYTILHYRRRAWNFLTKNFKFLKEINECIPPIIGFILSGFTVLYGIVITVSALAMNHNGVAIIYWALLKSSFVIALKFALPLVLIAAGIVAIVKLSE